MQKIKTKKLVIALMSILSVALIIVGVLTLPKIKTQAQIIEIDNVLDSRIALNREIEVPTSITVDFNGSQNASKGVIVCPDGKIINAGKISFNQTGAYELRYYFDYSGVTHTAIQKVEVYSDYFNLSNPNGGEIIVSDEENQLYCGKDGIIVNLKSGTNFVYNKVLDLRNTDENGLSPIIELDTRYGTYDYNDTPNFVGDDTYTPDALEGWIRLTDCYNPNIFIEIRMQRSIDYRGALFPGVRTLSQPITGMDKGDHPLLTSTNKKIILDGYPYRVWQTDGSMNVGLYDMGTALTTGAVWKYDMNTKRVYLSYNNGENFLVTDLDEPLIYDNENYFPGFTTGEVFVSIYAEGYESTYARTEIVSIGKDNLKEVANKQCVDDFAPQIVVEVDKTTETGIYGAVNDTVTIPSAKAIDVNLLGDVEVAVYRGYGTNMQTNVSVEDNKFLLKHSDLYTIEYKAKDKAGNVGKEIFTISAINTSDNRAISLSTLQSGTISAGQKIDNLYEVTNSINTDIDKVKVNVTIESEKQYIEGEGQTFSFTPYYAGDYTVTINYTDGVFAYEKVVVYTCEKSSNVVFIDKPLMPKYYVKGDYYSLEDVKAKTFTSGSPESVNTEVYAVFDGGQEVKINDINKVQITGANNVYFVYKAENATPLTTDTVSIITSEYYNLAGKKLGYDMAKFFVGDFTANATNALGGRIKNITFTSNKKEGDNVLSYFKAVSGRKFALEYKIVEKEDNFNALRINLTDKFNVQNKFTFEVFNKEDGTYISLNKGALIKLDSAKFTNELTTVSYDYETKFFRFGKTYSTSVDFNAKEVYLDIEMVDISEKSSIIISKVNNASISGNSYTDSTDPEVYLEDFQGDYAVGDIVKVGIPEFSDVISDINYQSATMQIVASDRNPVYDSKGNVLTNLVVGQEYDIKLDRITKFTVAYTISDFNGKTSTKTVSVNCVDTTAPTIKLDNIKDGQTIKVKQNGTVKINFTVSDDVTREKDLLVYIHLYCKDMFSFVPNVSNIKNENNPEDGVFKEEFTIPVKGYYEAQINVSDAEGNLLVKRINIVVE